MFKIFKNKNRKNKVYVDYSYIKDMPKYEDRINALKNIWR